MPKKPFAIHPFLIALWPVLFAYAQNAGVVPFSQAWRSIALLLGLALGILIPFALILHSAPRAAGVVSLFLALFLSYGYVYDALWERGYGYAATKESLLLMIAWLLLFAGGTGLIFRIREKWDDITRILNIVGVTLILISLVNIGIYLQRSRASVKVALTQSRVVPEAGSTRAGELPNIYYVVVDAYGRHDVLEEIYHHDNSEFLDFLEREGFFIAVSSRANYAQTELSLSSSLNLNYLDDVAAAMGPESDDHLPLRDLIQDSTVVRFLTEQGYTIVGLPSGYGPTTLTNSVSTVDSGRRWNDLEIRLLCSTPIPWLTVRGGILNPYAVHRQKILNSFDLLAATAELPSPRFVFAHILAPHGPFVFDEQGREVEPQEQYHLRDGPQDPRYRLSTAEYREGYIGQLVFVSDQIESVVKEILSSASAPTILILQSDHGPESLVDWNNPTNSYFKERFAILNAYRLPPDVSIGLYDEITPVNTFRLIFNYYFGTDLPLLEDISYFSIWAHPYAFSDVTDAAQSGTPPPSWEWTP